MSDLTKEFIAMKPESFESIKARAANFVDELNDKGHKFLFVRAFNDKDGNRAVRVGYRCD